MPALNFKAEFAPLVESGKKRQTIRQRRKYPIKVGDRLVMYTGIRTKACRCLIERRCKAVMPVLIDTGKVVLDGKLLAPDEEIAFAKRDGFKGFGAPWRMYEFFRDHYGLPFEGVLIQW